jgi:bacterioferritin (cytochrome b1)
MQPKPDVAIEANLASTSRVMQTLLEELSNEELERIAVEVIHEHRRRLQRAQELFEKISRLEGAPEHSDALCRVQHDYCIAMLDLHWQHQVVSLIVERLGHVPNVDTSSPPLN